MKPLLIRYALAANGHSQADVARSAGVGESMIYQVLRRSAKSEEVERAIALAAALPVCEVFPDRYNSAGELLPRRRTRSKMDFQSIVRLAERLAQTPEAA